MEERFSISYNQAYPRIPRVPRGWASSEFNSRLGLRYSLAYERRPRL
jgi:hypothetical protein